MTETEKTGLEKMIKDATALLVQRYGWEDSVVEGICFSRKIKIHYEDDVYTLKVVLTFTIAYDGVNLIFNVKYADVSAMTTLAEALCRSKHVPMETYYSVMHSFVSNAMRDVLLEYGFVNTRLGFSTYELDSLSLWKYETPDSLASTLEMIKEFTLQRFRTLVQDYFDECEENKG